jgi:hypothetical protein
MNERVVERAIVDQLVWGGGGEGLIFFLNTGRLPCYEILISDQLA